MAGAQEPLETIVPYRLGPPLAPQVAAQQQGVRIQIPRLLRSFREISSRHACTLVEGAGGILVPLTRRLAMVDFMEQLKLPVLLVSRLGLGTLNHTLLTVHHLLHRKIPVIGIVLNDPDGQKDPAKGTNPSVLQQWSPVPILGLIPYRKGIRLTKDLEDRVADKVARHTDTDRILESCTF
jgi:dethiobiotin synthetase